MNQEQLIEAWEEGLLNYDGCNQLISTLLYPESPIFKAKKLMNELPREHNPKVKQRGYKKS